MRKTLTYLGATLALALPAAAGWAEPPYGVGGQQSPIQLVDCGPQLTRAAAEAYLDILRFMVGVVGGVELGPPTQEEKDVFASALAAEYCRNVTDEARAFIASAPAFLAELRAGWPELEESRRTALREVWRRQLSPLPETGSEPELVPVDSPLDAQRRAQFVSEMLRIQHETMMVIIRNMGPSCPSWRTDCD